MMEPSDTKMRRTIGVIGLGSLGLPLAANLLRAGFDVLGYARRPVEELSKLGGRLAPSVSALGTQCTSIITCLPSPEALADIISGGGKLCASLAPGSVVIDVSTLPVAAKLAQREALRNVGAGMLDCGISGNHRYVANWTAGLFASGLRMEFDRCADVLAALTPRVTYVGEFGAGTTLKLIASLLVPIHTLAAAEALTLAKRAGVDPQLALSALAGTQASSGMLESRGARMVAGDFSGPSLAGYYERNVRATLDLAERVGGRYPLLAAMADCYRDAISSGLGDLDQSAMIAYLTDRSV
jgi:3-hydroxyisobutyrate dehydrogenase